MTEFTDICEYLASNPLANNLIAFLNLYELRGSKPAYAALFSSLAPYAFAVKDNDASYQTTAPIVEKALQNELDGNVITGLNNFWEIFFLDQDWSDQTLRIWECYQRYEIDEIEERERDDGGNPLIAQTKYLSRESNPKETLKLTHRQKNPKMFTGLETLEEGIPLGTSGGSQRQETNKEVHCPELTEGNKIVEMKLTYKNKILIENMTEKEIWDWLIFFQDNFLNQLINPNSNSLRLFPSLVIEDKGSQIRNKYCHTSHNYQIKGTTNNYQVDFLVKSIDVPSNEIHHWCEENIKENFKGKRSDMTYFETDILPKFSNNFDDLKELARKLHKILFGDGQVNFGTPIEYEPVYRDMIGAFDEVIALIRGKIHQ
ncbi:hypothetical protein BGT96224_Ac31433 [Blumeria graminis f. sp. tritici 96224]|nr:hypothetical protein BGT96224_Ac31433 [Blumeria graminis f. sp. tritici 96224]